MTKKQEWERFIELCINLKTKKNFEEFFDLIFTLEEKKDIAKRMEVIRLLLQEELSQREIAKTAETSIFKVTRGSNALKTTPPSLKKFLSCSFMINPCHPGSKNRD